MRCVGWEEAIGRPVLCLAKNTLRGTKVTGSDVEAWFKGYPNDCQSMYCKGMTYVRITDRHNKGWEYLQRALESGLEGPQARLLRGKNTLQDHGSRQDIGSLMTALKECESSREKEVINGKIGYILYSSGDYADAAGHYEAAKRICLRPEWLNNLGCCYLKSGDRESGRRFLEKAANLVPCNDRIRDNKVQSDLLCGGRQTLSDFLASFMHAGTLGEGHREEFLSLVSLASEMKLISDRERDEYILLTDLASGNVEEVIPALAERSEGFKGPGAKFEADVFSILYNYAITEWPERYSLSVREAILNACSAPVILEGLRQFTTGRDSSRYVTLDYVLSMFLDLRSGKEDPNVLKKLTKALESDPSGLVMVVNNEKIIKSLLDQSEAAKQWVKLGQEKYNAAMREYNIDICYHMVKSQESSYFENVKLFYESAVEIYPKNPDLLEKYADLLKALRCAEKANIIYGRVACIAPDRAKRIIEKMERCHRSIIQ